MRTEKEQTLRERLPHPALRRDVVCVWTRRVAAGAPAQSFRSVPNGAVEIVCSPGEEPLVHGPRTGPSRDLVAPGTLTVGLRLRPGAAAGVLGVGVDELLDLTVVAGDLLGIEAAARIADCGSAPALFRELERQVLARPSQPDTLALHAANRLHRPGSVGAIARELSISERQLRRRCLVATGHSPKALQRLFRYQRFLALADPQRSSPGLSRLAAEAGYADQAHLTREARRLAGLSPAAVLREAATDCVGAHDHLASRALFLAAA